jgi:hypothetical protein
VFVCYITRQKLMDGTHLGFSGFRMWRVSVWSVRRGEIGIGEVVKVEGATCTPFVLRNRQSVGRLDEPVKELVACVV